MLTITYQDALAALRAAVAEKGEDYVYEKVGADDGINSCVYKTENNEPSCIVGNALVRLGVPIRSLPSPRGLQTNAKALLGYTAYYSRPALRGVRATVFAANLFDSVQVLQDEGMPWGEAVEQGALEIPDGDS